MGGMPLRSKRARERQSLASSRSPWTTWMATLVWPSTPVVKCSVALAGMVELRWMILATTPPRASMPSESGVTSRRRRSSVAAEPPARIWAWTAAPRATTSSGLSSVWGFLPRGGEVEEVVDEGADGGDAGGAADEDDFVDLRGVEAGVLEGLAAGGGGAGDDGGGELVELLAGDLAEVVLAAGELDVERGGGGGGELDLGFDDGFADGLDGFAVGAEVFAEVAGDVVERDGDEEVVDVVAAEVGVAVGGDDLEDALVELEDGDVEGAAAEVVDGDEAVLVLVEAVGEGGGGGLVDEAEDFEAGDAAGVLGGLALGVVEVGGDGDDGLGDGGAEEALGVLLQLLEDVGGDLGRGEEEAAYAELEDFAGLEVVGEFEGEELELVLDVGDVAAHEALGGVDGAGGVGEQGGAGGVADDDAVVGPGDDGGHEAFAVFAGDDDRGVVLRLAVLHIGHQGVRRAQINPYYALIRHA